MAKIWRSAVVGTGVVGSWHVKMLGGMEDAELVALCDIDPAKAHAAIKSTGVKTVPVYSDLAEMLKKEKLDVVHVCTPSGDHLNPAITVMQAGVNAIVEKPMEIVLSRIEQMRDVAKKQGVRLAGIFQNRWNAANKAIYDAVKEGRFGTISFGGSYTPWYRTDQYYRDGGWRGTWKLDGGGAIMNQSVHSVDLLQWICGPIKQVSAYASSRIHPEIEVEDTLSCSLQFESGAFGTIMGSTAMWPGHSVRLEVGGENGTAVFDGQMKHFKFRDERPADAVLIDQINNPKGATTSGGGTSNTDVGLELHIMNIQHIHRAWEAGRDADTHADEARKAVAIILAMYESAKQGGAPVKVG